MLFGAMAVLVYQWREEKCLKGLNCRHINWLMEFSLPTHLLAHVESDPSIRQIVAQFCARFS